MIAPVKSVLVMLVMEMIAKGLKMKNKLKEIASKCPVHKTVANKVHFNTEIIQ